MSTRQNRLALIIIALLFFVPLMLAMLMRSTWWNYSPDSTINAGTLLKPPVPIELDQARIEHGSDKRLAGQWLMLYLLAPDCDRQCEQEATSLRQVQRASGRDRVRVAVVLLSPTRPESGVTERLVTIDPEFVILSDGRDAVRPALETAGAEQGQAFIVDPSGNIILSYGAAFEPSDINRDLKRLLKWSAQGKSS